MEWEVKPRMYNDILETIVDNISNMEYIPGKNTIKIKKKDMVFEVTEPGEVQEIYELMWDVNNFICRQYRRRKHILKTTVITDG
jgi:hypothetical protein